MHAVEALFGWRRSCRAYQRAAHINSSMSSRSSPRSPRTRRASSKSDKADIYDANIRNFAPVARIMKNALPENAKIAKEAKECMQECVSEFISFITSEGKPAPLLVASALGPYHLTYHSFGEVPSRKEENSQRRGHSLRHELARF